MMMLSPGTWPASAYAGHQRLTHSKTTTTTKTKIKSNTKTNRQDKKRKEKKRQMQTKVQQQLHAMDKGELLCGQAADERFLKQNLRYWNLVGT